MKPRALLFSYCFPPAAVAESYLSAKTLGETKSHIIDVLCAAPDKAALGNDRSLKDFVERSFEKVHFVEPPKWLKTPWQSELFRKGMTALFPYPDPFVLWTPQAIRRAEELSMDRYDVLVTWSNFLSAHIVGLRLKKRHPRLRWVAHLSDPWVDNPLWKFRGINRLVNQKMEKAVFRYADALVLTSELTVEQVCGRHGSDVKKKSFVVPHPFTPALYPKKGSNYRKGIVIRYVGKFYGERNPKALFQALTTLDEKAPEILEGVSFEFIGTAVGDSRWGGKNLPPSLIKYVPAVNYVESLALMAEADALLVIDAPAQESLFLPSKLVDYLGAKKMILGITPPGTSASLINAVGGRWADPRNIAGIILMLEEAIPRLKKKESWMPRDVEKEFSGAFVGEKMGRVLLGLNCTAEENNKKWDHLRPEA